MNSVKAIRGVLNNFLATYTSRNSDYDGYWLFGLLIKDLVNLNFDLLKDVKETSRPTPLQFAEISAARKFRHQLQKAGVSAARITEARLEITKTSDTICSFHGHWGRTAHVVRVYAHVKSNHSRLFTAETSLFVAPHSFFFERRSTRRL